MIQEICKDERFLAQKAEPATPADLPIAQDLIDTLTAHKDGCVGMAANMIGVNKRIIIFDNEGAYQVMFNPVIKLGLAASKQVEGCFTHEEPVTVTRYDRIKVSYEELVDGKLVPRKGDFRGWVAQLIQHMADHGKGKFI